MRKNLKIFANSEGGAAELIEAVLIYPVVFLALFFLIYIGLYTIQYATVESYAEKIAVVVARDVASPGYLKMMTNNTFENVAVDANINPSEGQSIKEKISSILSVEKNPSNVELVAYRYWGDPINGKTKSDAQAMLQNIVNNNSILCGGNTKVNISCENNFLAQYINVSVTQELESFAILDFFGIDRPSVKIHTKCAVNDVDEFIRNTDFAVDAIEVLANKIGIDVNKMKETVYSVKEKFGLH